MKNKISFLLVVLFFQTTYLQAQYALPRFEAATIDDFTLIGGNANDWMEYVVPEPPPEPVRTMAEWEELQALVITWRGGGNIQNGILREIVRHAREEVNVIIVCPNETTVQNSLDAGGVDWSSNVTFLEVPSNTVWVRDYGPNTVYANDVGQQFFIDWIYNRYNREEDDAVPIEIGNAMNIQVFETTAEPFDLVHTGGNFMTDGMGTAFSSKLVLDENDETNDHGISDHSPQAIDSIMNEFMGIDLGRYIRMENLEFDPIDHIDMHMKLLDEETLLVGEYPEGIADGPQIEANLQFVLDNFTTPFGNPYNVIRIPMPPDFGGLFPSNGPFGGDYRTYANSIIINKTILVPFYEEQFDTTAQRIWEEAMPGYNIQGINCNNIIGLNGALHCITKEVGVAEPLLINHARVSSGCGGESELIEAFIQHHSGIASAELFFTTDLSMGYEFVPMTSSIGGNSFIAEIPAQTEGTEVFYYIQATANDGKTINRPMPAPAGYFHYQVADCTVDNENVLLRNINLERIYPNPASAITVVPVTTEVAVEAFIEVVDVLGRRVETLFDGKLPVGDSNYFIHADEYAAGTYFVLLKTSQQSFVQKLIVR